MFHLCFLWVLLIYTICSCHSYNHVCVFRLNQDVWVSACVCVWGSVCRGVCIGGRDGSCRSYQCVCAHALFPSTHGLSLCIRKYICVASVFWVRRCAVDFGVEPALRSCFWCVSVVFVYCGCTALACLDLAHLNSRGRVCQRFLLHPSNTTDNLESISVRWTRDYLRAI